jgi:hypothetical protein
MMIRSPNAQHERRFFVDDVPVTNIKVVCGPENVSVQQRISLSTMPSAGFYQNKR